MRAISLRYSGMQTHQTDFTSLVLNIDLSSVYNLIIHKNGQEATHLYHSSMDPLSVRLFAWQIAICLQEKCLLQKKPFMLPRLIAIHFQSIAVGSSVIASIN